MKTQWLIDPCADDGRINLNGVTSIRSAQWSVDMEHFTLGEGLQTFQSTAKVHDPVNIETSNKLLGSWLVVHFCFSGQTSLILPDDSEVPFTEGDVTIFTPVDWQFRYIFPEHSNLNHFTFFIREDVLERLLGEYVPPNLSQLLIGGISDCRVIRYKLSSKMHTLARLIISSELTGALRGIQLEALVMQLLTLIAEQSGDETQGTRSKPITRRERDSVIEVYERMTTNLGEAHTIGALAATVSMSERRLNKVFDEVFGMSVLKKLKSERMDAARFILDSEEVMLKQIAHRVGFKHVTNFVRAYTHHFSTPPRKHVRSIQDSPSAK